jgi:hypothetical protein
VTIRPRGGKSLITVVAVFYRPKCARICARATLFLLARARESLNNEFVQITCETTVELMCSEKQRNRENFNLRPLRLPFRLIGTVSLSLATFCSATNCDLP